VAFFDDLHARIGDMFWVIVIGAPVLVLVLVLQIVLRVRLRTKQLKQLFRAGAIETDRSKPVDGPLAFGLACGAQMAVNQGVAWNDPAGTGFTKLALREQLADVWGVSGPGDWQRTMDRLLAERKDDPAGVAVELRDGDVVDLVAWQRIIERSEVVNRSAVVAATERIHRYEERVRADGLIPADGVVSSLRAYDWGRAVNMARWGVRAGYCDQATAERGVLRAGELCAKRYGSWEELSAGFGLGRMLSFDDADFPLHYVELREAHRKLLGEAGSPWRTLSWETPSWPTPVTRP
jgi:hypothetical protein